MATQATLINGEGKKVVVTSGSPEAQKFFSQGYSLMGADKTAPAKASTSGAPYVAPATNAAPAPAPAVTPKTDATGAAPTKTDTPAPAAPAPEAAANNPATPTNNNQAANNVQNDGIAALLSSGREFTAEDAKNYAYSKGEANYQQYIGGVAGSKNDLYISPTNFSNLQKTYTPYQIEKAITRTANGIYWNPNVNIGDIPSQDPAAQINADTKKLSSIVSDAKKSADKTTTDDAKKTETKTDQVADTSAENKDTIMSMLTGQFGDSAEDTYNKLFNTDEIKNARAEVTKYKEEIDTYDEQLDALKDDIRKEVEGEASESYITALATVRGDKILRAKRAAQRSYDTANANYTSLTENATNLLQVKTSDSNNRYNRLFSMLQLQIQQEGTSFNQALALNQLALQIPEGRSMTVGDTKVTGLKENDNLNVVQFTEANGKTYVIGVDKKTGEQKYKQYIGTAKVTGSGGSTSAVSQLAEYKAIQELGDIKNLSTNLASGAWAKGVDDKGKTFVYDNTAYTNDLKAWQNKKDDSFWNFTIAGKEPSKYDYEIAQ